MKDSKKYGLDESDINNIVRVISGNTKVDEVILFGSRAKGTFSNGSDIDIAIKGKGIYMRDIADLLVDLDELDLPYMFDIVIYNNIKEPALKSHIDRCGVRLNAF